jgi:hypothetical protein
MEEDPASLTEKRRTLRSVRWLILFIALATAVGWFLMPPATEPKTLFLHPDGQLSLGRRDGEKFAPSAISSWPSPQITLISDHFVLDAPPETPASKWGDTFEQLATLGYASYQLRSAGESMNFHIPTYAGTTYSTRSEPQWIDIRRSPGEKPKLPQMFDVVVIADESTTCGEILAATRPHRVPGKSLRVTSMTLELLRTQSEDAEHEPPKYSLVDRVRSIFRR